MVDLIKDEPEIIKELKKEENLGLLCSKRQGDYEELELTEKYSEDVPVDAAGFVENDVKDVIEESNYYNLSTEKLYRNVVELLPDGLVTVNLKGVVTSCNTAETKILGFSRDELIGKHFTKIGIFRARDIPKYVKLFSSIISGKGLIKPIEVEFYRKDGTVFLGEVRLTLLKEKGRPIGIIAITRDITDRKQAEESLRESEEKFRNLAEESPNMIFINKSGRIAYANRKCEEIMGYKREEFYSSDFNILNLIASEYKDLIRENLKKHNLYNLR